MFPIRILTAITLSLLFMLGAAAGNPRYVFNNIIDHGNHDCLDFLLGNWVCKDKTCNFSESWSRTADGQLIGIRKFGQPAEYDLFSAYHTNAGLCVSMKRMSDIHWQALSGTVGSRTTNKAVISCRTSEKSPAVISTTEYDSPDDDILEVTVELVTEGTQLDVVTQTLNSSKKVYTLRRDIEVPDPVSH